MATIKIYAKTAVNLQTKMGAYCFYLVRHGEDFHKGKSFKKSCATLAQADCMAYVVALHYFVGTEICSKATEIQIISDSGVVIDLLDTYKSQKHCEEVVEFWRKNVQPLFPEGVKFVYKKVSSKILAGDFDSTYLSRCIAMANGELNKLKEIYK